MGKGLEKMYFNFSNGRLFKCLFLILQKGVPIET